MSENDRHSQQVLMDRLRFVVKAHSARTESFNPEPTAKVSGASAPMRLPKVIAVTDTSARSPLRRWLRVKRVECLTLRRAHEGVRVEVTSKEMGLAVGSWRR